MSRLASSEQVDEFRAMLAQEVGLSFGDDKVALLEEVLTERVEVTGASSVAIYLRELAASPREIAEVAQALTVSETYFLRNRNQFDALRTLLQDRDAAGMRHVRMLSAGCSSGEETYSLAMILRESVKNTNDWTVEILGVDLNPRAIDRATAGTYSQWSLRETPETLRRKYFSRTRQRYLIGDGLQRMVRFERGNLIDSGAGCWQPGHWDVVFFRNVLIYFTPEAARDIITNVARSLKPGGHLFLGHAENLRGLSHDFHLRHTHGTFYYARRDTLEPGGQRAAPSPPDTVEAPIAPIPDDTSWLEAIGEASRRIENLSKRRGEGARARKHRPSREEPEARPTDDLAGALDLMGEERFAEALTVLAGAPSGRSDEPDVLLLRAVALLSTGELDEAMARCEQILEIDELNPGAHYLMALCREHEANYEEAIEHSRAAAYLDSEFAMPHLHLGRLARRSGELAEARRELHLALGLLPREDPARIVLFGGGFGREALIRLCRAELEACEEGQ